MGLVIGDYENTYEGVADSIGLHGWTRDKYVMYMKKRWGSRGKEIENCRCGYAKEWANRFRRKEEYACSDSEGKRILNNLYKDNVFC